MTEEQLNEAIKDLNDKCLTEDQQSLVNYLIANKDDILEAFAD